MTATRCRPPTLRDLSTELTFEVADFCSGSRAAVAGGLMAQPVYPQLRKYPVRSGTHASCHKLPSRPRVVPFTATGKNLGDAYAAEKRALTFYSNFKDGIRLQIFPDIAFNDGRQMG
jgi:hypothetical protein